LVLEVLLELEVVRVLMVVMVEEVSHPLSVAIAPQLEVMEVL
jgi:hypothetical protein